MQDLIFRFLKSSGIDPIYFIAGILDVLSAFLWIGLKGALPYWRRSLYKGVILMAIVLTAGVLCKYFGLFDE